MNRNAPRWKDFQFSFLILVSGEVFVVVVFVVVLLFVVKTVTSRRSRMTLIWEIRHFCWRRSKRMKTLDGPADVLSIKEKRKWNINRMSVWETDAHNQLGDSLWALPNFCASSQILCTLCAQSLSFCERAQKFVRAHRSVWGAWGVNCPPLIDTVLCSVNQRG